MAGERLALTVLMGVLLVAVVAAIARAEGWTGVSTPGTTRSSAEARDKPSGALRWLTTVDHKDIGILYGGYSVLMFAWAGGAAMLMRTELVTPTETVISPSFYNALLTSHGLTMLILFGTPVLAAFSNYFIPILVGADDMAFPRINAIAFWLLPPGALLVWAGFFLGPVTGGAVGPAATSWTMYAPLSVEQPNPGVDLMLLGLHLTGVSATMGAINFTTTIFTERGEDVTWANLDIFSWTVLVQSGQILFAFPLLGSVFIMLLMDRNFGTTFFAVEGGGPILYQHLFWFWGHPEVYILILPAMGIVSWILPKFAGRKLFGFKYVVYSTLAIGVLSFGVWGHHMFSSGIDPRIRASFMAVTLAIAVPTAVKTFNWITTLWNGRIRLTAPMLFCLGFVSNLIIGGVTGVFLASTPVDLLLHETYYIVGHFHYFLMGGTVFAVFAGIYYWFPIVTGRMYQRTLAKWHFWLSMIGVNVTFFAMLVLGYLGMPRKYATYAFDPGLAPLASVNLLHQITTVGAFVILFGQIIWIWNVVSSYLEGPEVTDPDPWNTKSDGLHGREFAWFEEQLATEGKLATTDGGDGPESDVATDGGEE
ncbi:cbb3-type cytochrome c oxidase subunit I [Natronomonas marina]|jgi:cytochrome c oxidase subunit 1|uniref:cbb3-type cytochrome c oxidase subunit I n=1 Tax=Natronomonas marina TaxID=2961939 RepID=UPI0020CA18F5|nr:cbb3-type cytochrome c oxidase subunit I [Natronomonas marina]